MALRVIAGQARGRKLAVPEGDLTRPTLSRVREAMFNSLISLGLIDQSRVLDLYAGTGALGIEALSRGASAVTFVENQFEAVQTLQTNLITTGFKCRSVIMYDDVDVALEVLRERENEQMFDVAIIDPPYIFDGWPDLMRSVPSKVAVVQSNRRISMCGDWQVLNFKRYGETTLTYAVRTAAHTHQNTTHIPPHHRSAHAPTRTTQPYQHTSTEPHTHVHNTIS